MCGPGTPIQDIPFSHIYLRDHEGGGGDILRPALSSQFSASTLQDGDRHRNSPRARPVELEFCRLLVLLTLQTLQALPRKACLSLSLPSFLLLPGKHLGSQASAPNIRKSLSSFSVPSVPFLASAPENSPFFSFCDFPGFLLSCHPGCPLPSLLPQEPSIPQEPAPHS